MKLKIFEKDSFINPARIYIHIFIPNHNFHWTLCFRITDNKILLENTTTLLLYPSLLSNIKKNSSNSVCFINISLRNNFMKCRIRIYKFWNRRNIFDRNKITILSKYDIIFWKISRFSLIEILFSYLTTRNTIYLIHSYQLMIIFSIISKHHTFNLKSSSINQNHRKDLC